MELSNRSSNWLVNEAGSTSADLYSALALGLMAATTPAWTERYVELLDGAIARILTERPVGVDGRTDPLLATDCFGYTARLMLLLGVRSTVRPDEVWSRLTFTALSPTEFTWTSNDVADLVATRLQRPNDCTDDGSPSLSLLAAASLGLQLVGHTVPEEAGLAVAEAPATACSADHLFTLFLASALAGDRSDTIEPLVDRALDVLVSSLRTGGSVDGETAALALALARERDRRDIVTSLCERSNGRFEDDAAASHPSAAALAAASGAGRLRRLAAGLDEAVPTVVDLDQSEASLIRAEWIDGALLLRFVAVDEDPGAWMTFRIVGAEPRLWYLTGIDRSWMDVTSSAVIMRVPRVSGTLELTPGSY